MNCPQKLIKWRRTDIDLIRCQRATISSTIDKFLHLLIKMKIVWPFIPSMVMYFREGWLGIKSENTNKTIERRAWRYQREVIRISKSKNDRQHNGQKKIDTRISNDLQNITYNKTKDRVTRTQLKSEGELRCSGMVSSSCSTNDADLFMDRWHFQFYSFRIETWNEETNHGSVFIS